MRFMYTTQEFENIDEESLLVVFDTNVLLDLYRLPEETLEHLIEQLDMKLNLFWIPNQVYIEYLRNSGGGRDTCYFRPLVK
ncbi:MAG: PIN-like domain-containing protein [Romboutsia sp.]|uniref:PIN-like domain-containing protein n=1 Tax=Romboutsia sp. TaxID=1965302 RepID=UPI003F2B2D6F